MSDTAAKARAMRLERLRSMLDQQLTDPRAALETLMGQTTSENIRCYLEEAADHIFDLVYADDAELIADEPQALDEAA